jgi:endonuclease I
MILTSCGSINNDSNSEQTSEPDISESETESELTPETTYFTNENLEAKSVKISELLALGKLGGANGSETVKRDTLYRIKGIVQFPTNTTYGNFDLVDETGSILVYGCSNGSTTITKNGTTYYYTNNKTFSSLNIKAGDEITMEGLYVAYIYYGGDYKREFQGYCTKKTTGLIKEIEAKNYTSAETYEGNYYSTVNNLTGKELLKGLHNLMMDTHTTYVSYDSLKTTLKESDQYQNTSYATCFYSGTKATSFNREHVWCQSLSGSSSSSSTNLYGTTYGGSDIHHIRPSIASYNSLRSNAAYGIIYGPKQGLKNIPYANGEKSYVASGVIEPADAIKGDCARIVMYMYMLYSSSIVGDGSKY